MDNVKDLKDLSKKLRELNTNTKEEAAIKEDTTDPVTKKTWEEFRSNGLLWFINTILHLFGWAIVIDFSENGKEIIDVYPARVSYRGFSEEINTYGYNKVTQYLKDNIEDLAKESEE